MAISLGGYLLKTYFAFTVFAVLTLLLHGVSNVATNRVSVLVTNGDSVTLHTNITMHQWDRVKWYFIDSLIAQVTGDLRYICTDVKCNKANEGFRDRLKLDHQTGDLTITDISTSDADVYLLKIFRGRDDTGNTFQVVVVDAAEMKRKSVKRGESVTLDTREERNPSDVMTWYFNDTLVAEIAGDQSKICEDDRCPERFRDRLELDQTGSLIISNTRTTDSGDYTLEIQSNRDRYSITSIKSFTLSVTDSSVSSAAVAGICAGVCVVLLLVAAVYYYRWTRRDRKNIPTDDKKRLRNQRRSHHRAMAKLTFARPSQSNTDSESEVD